MGVKLKHLIKIKTKLNMLDGAKENPARSAKTQVQGKL